MQFAQITTLSALLALAPATASWAEKADEPEETDLTEAAPAVSETEETQEPMAPGTMLELTVVNLGEGEGPIRVAIDTQETWFVKDADPIRTYDILLDGEEAALQIQDIEPGVYAVRVYHDENGDGELDTNFLGIPKEPYGFSGERTDRMRPRSFDYAQFTLDAPMRMTITLR